MVDKKAEGQARKAAKKMAEESRQAAAEQAAADAEWEVGAKKGNKKAEADAEKKAAKAERKAAAEAELEEEMRQLTAPKGGKDKTKKAASKKTRAEIAAEAMARLAAGEKAEAKKKKEIKDTGGNEYIGVLEENKNMIGDIEASGIDEAIGAMELANAKSGVPEKTRINLRALHAAYEARELPRLKEEMPGLKLSQYKERIFNAWQKSPENPMNALPQK